MIDIQGYRKLKRDSKSFAVINTDKQEYNQTKQRQQIITNLITNNKELRSELDKIREEMQEIQNLLKVTLNVSTTTT